MAHTRLISTYTLRTRTVTIAAVSLLLLVSLIFAVLGPGAPPGSLLAAEVQTGDQKSGKQASSHQRDLQESGNPNKEEAAQSKDHGGLNPFGGDDEAIAGGKTLFRQLCTGCHGGRGRGGKGPDLTDTRWLHGSGDAEVFRVVQRGVSGTTMKQLGESISDEQIWKIIAFVRTLARAAGDPEWKPYMPGDPIVGKKLFFDEKGKTACVKCHSVDGKGGKIGPPLSRIAAQRSPQYLMESIVLPSADIDPNYEGVVVVTRRGRVITGVRVNEDNFSIQLRDQETGRLYSFFKRDLDEVTKQEKSLMPENLAEQLNVKELHDLFAYVMTLDGQTGKPASQRVSESVKRARLGSSDSPTRRLADSPAPAATKAP